MLEFCCRLTIWYSILAEFHYQASKQKIERRKKVFDVGMSSMYENIGRRQKDEHRNCFQ